MCLTSGPSPPEFPTPLPPALQARLTRLSVPPTDLRACQVVGPQKTPVIHHHDNEMQAKEALVSSVARPEFDNVQSPIAQKEMHKNEDPPRAPVAFYNRRNYMTIDDKGKVVFLGPVPKELVLEKALGCGGFAQVFEAQYDRTMRVCFFLYFSSFFDFCLYLFILDLFDLFICLILIFLGGSEDPILCEPQILFIRNDNYDDISEGIRAVDGSHTGIGDPRTLLHCNGPCSWGGLVRYPGKKKYSFQFLFIFCYFLFYFFLILFL